MIIASLQVHNADTVSLIIIITHGPITQSNSTCLVYNFFRLSV